MIYDTVLYTIRPITGYANSSRATSEREPSVSRSPITPVIEVVLSKISLRGQKWGQRRFTTLIIDRYYYSSLGVEFSILPTFVSSRKKKKKEKEKSVERIFTFHKQFVPIFRITNYYFNLPRNLIDFSRTK